MKETYYISDAAKEIEVESHVLRYWEEELKLPIKRNELGHRYYTRADVELFRKVKDLKERGLQLKAIKAIMDDGRLEDWSTGNWYLESGKGQTQKEENTLRTESLKGEELEEVRKRVLEREKYNFIMGQERLEDNGLKKNTDGDVLETESSGMGIMILESRDLNPSEKEEKAKRIQSLLRQIIQETVRESSQEICREIKNSVLKELDYQFRIQEERLEEREEQRMRQSEEYYRRMDELLREKSGRDESKKGVKRIWKRIFVKKTKEYEEHMLKKVD